MSASFCAGSWYFGLLFRLILYCRHFVVSLSFSCLLSWPATNAIQLQARIWHSATKWWHLCFAAKYINNKMDPSDQTAVSDSFQVKSHEWMKIFRRNRSQSKPKHPGSPRNVVEVCVQHILHGERLQIYSSVCNYNGIWFFSPSKTLINLLISQNCIHSSMNMLPIKPRLAPRLQIKFLPQM